MTHSSSVTHKRYKSYGGASKSVRRAIHNITKQNSHLQKLIDIVQSGPTTPGIVINRQQCGHIHIKSFTEIPHKYLHNPKKWGRISANNNIHVIVPLHWYYKDVSSTNLKAKKDAIENLVKFVTSQKLKLTLLGDFNTTDLIDDTSFLQTCGFHVPLAPDTRDAQGNITYILTTDTDFIESTAILNHRYSVPEEWQSNYKNYLRASVSQFKEQYENETLRPMLHLDKFRNHLFTQLKKIVLATNTEFLLDHTPPRSVTSTDGACTLTCICPCGANGTTDEELLAIFPLFGFAVGFIVKELPMLEINKQDWIHKLSNFFYKDVLHLQNNELKHLKKSQFSKFPLSFEPVRAFFKTHVLEPFNDLKVESCLA